MNLTESVGWIEKNPFLSVETEESKGDSTTVAPLIGASVSASCTYPLIGTIGNGELKVDGVDTAGSNGAVLGSVTHD